MTLCTNSKNLIKVWLALVNILYPLDKTINAPLLLCYVRHRNILALRTEEPFRVMRRRWRNAERFPAYLFLQVYSQSIEFSTAINGLK